jgi:hypothetical protein
MNLFQMATDNAGSLEQQAQHLRESNAGDRDASELMDCFVRRVQADGRIGVNMRPWVLARFLSRGIYRNIYGWADEMADLSGGDADAFVGKKLGDYRDKRRAFDAAFEDSERFGYGALTIGGAGAERYGEFCFVAGEAFAGNIGDAPRILRVRSGADAQHVTWARGRPFSIKEFMASSAGCRSRPMPSATIPQGQTTNT